MATLPTLLSTSNNTITAVDTIRYNFPDDIEIVHTFFIESTPDEFDSMDTLSWTAVYRVDPVNYADDVYGLEVRILTSDQLTVLAGASSTLASSWTTIDSTVNNTTDATAGPTSFAYVNTTATKAQWDEAWVELRQTYTKTRGGDAANIEVNYVAFTGTFTAGPSTPTSITTTEVAGDVEIGWTDPATYATATEWTVERIDGALPTAGTQVSSVAVSPTTGLQGNAYDPIELSIWCAYNLVTNIFEFDPSDGTQLSSFVSTTNGSNYGIVVNGSLLAILVSSDEIAEHTKTGTLSDTLSTPTSITLPRGITHDGTTYWITGVEASSEIVKLDPSDTTVALVRHETDIPYPGLAWFNGLLYGLREDESVDVIEPGTGTVLDTFSLGGTVGNTTFGLSIEGERVWVTDQTNGRLRKFESGAFGTADSTFTGITSEPYTDTTVSPSSTYTYRVQATAPNRSSGWSGSSEITTGAGGESYTGDGSGTLTPVTSTATGTLSAPAYTGTGSGTLSPVTSTATGTLAYPTWTGTGSGTLSPATGTASGTSSGPTFTGNGQGTLAPATGAATGTWTVPTYTGTGTATLSPVTSTATGTIEAGAVTVTPSVASEPATALDPTVTAGSVTTFPSVTPEAMVGLDATVAAGAVTVTAPVASELATALDPTATSGAPTVTPPVAAELATALDATATPGAVSTTPAVTPEAMVGLNPTVALGYALTGYRFRNDDGSESTATWIAAEDGNIQANVGDEVRIRFQIDNIPDGAQVTIQYAEDDGTLDWQDVTT